MYVTFQREEAKAVDRTAVAWTGSSGNLRPFWPSILHHRFAEKSQFHERQEAKARGSLRKAETEVFRGRGLVLPIEGNRHEPALAEVDLGFDRLKGSRAQACGRTRPWQHPGSIQRTLSPNLGLGTGWEMVGSIRRFAGSWRWRWRGRGRVEPGERAASALIGPIRALSGAWVILQLCLLGWRTGGRTHHRDLSVLTFSNTACTQ